MLGNREPMSLILADRRDGSNAIFFGLPAAQVLHRSTARVPGRGCRNATLPALREGRSLLRGGLGWVSPRKTRKAQNGKVPQRRGASA